MNNPARSFAALRFRGPGDALLRAAQRYADAVPQDCLPAGHSPETASAYYAYWLEASAHVAAANSYNSKAAALLRSAADTREASADRTESCYLRIAALAAKVNADRTNVVAALASFRSLASTIDELEQHDPPTAMRIDVLLMHAFASIAAQQLAAADQPLAHAWDLASMLSDDPELAAYHRARILGARALVAGQSGQHDAAMAWAQQAYEIAETINDRMQLATMAQYRASLLVNAGELERAIEQTTIALADAPQLGEMFLGTTQRLHGTLLLAQERPEQGLQQLYAALAIAQRHRDSDLPSVAPLVVAIAQQLMQDDKTGEAAALLDTYAEDLDAESGESAVNIDILRYTTFLRSDRVADAAEAIGRVADEYAAAHHTDTARAYEACADAWQSAAEPERAEEARARMRELS